MAEAGVAEVVADGDGGGERHVEGERLGDGGGDATGLLDVGRAGDVVVADVGTAVAAARRSLARERGDVRLRLAVRAHHRPGEGDPVEVAHPAGAHRVLRFRMATAALAAHGASVRISAASTSARIVPRWTQSCVALTRRSSSLQSPWVQVSLPPVTAERPLARGAPRARRSVTWSS